MINKTDIQKMVDKAQGLPITFEGTIRFRGYDEDEIQTFCFCTDEFTERLTEDENFDNGIFYYFHKVEEIEEAMQENEFADFLLKDIDFDSVGWVQNL